MIEFIVEDAARRDGKYIVVGRNAAPLRVGDRFTLAARNKSCKTFDEFIQPAVRETQRPVDLTVTRIESYQKEFEELSKGMTALLELTGPPGQVIESYDILTTE